MRSARSEFLSIMTVLALPLALAAVFPYRAINFVAKPAPTGSEAAVALIELDKAAAAAAMRSAKAAWQGDARQLRELRAELAFGELPEVPPAEVLSIDRRLREGKPALIDYELGPFLPSARAAEARPIAPEAAKKPEPVFKRDELLKLD